MLSMMKTTTLRPARFTAALSAGWCTGVKRRASSSGAKCFLYLTLPALPMVRRMQNGLLRMRLALPLSAV